EVAPGGFHASVFGLVVDVDDGEPAVLVGQQAHMPADRPWGGPVGRPAGPAPARCSHLGQVHVTVGAGDQGLLDGFPRLVVDQPVANQVELTGLFVGVHHVAERVDDDDAHRSCGNDVPEHLGYGEAGLFGG